MASLWLAGRLAMIDALHVPALAAAAADILFLPVLGISLLPAVTVALHTTWRGSISPVRSATALGACFC